MKVDRERNCYNCGEFGHITRYYRNWRFVEQERKMEYADNHRTDNLKEEKSLVILE